MQVDSIDYRYHGKRQEQSKISHAHGFSIDRPIKFFSRNETETKTNWLRGTPVCGYSYAQAIEQTADENVPLRCLEPLTPCDLCP